MVIGVKDQTGWRNLIRRKDVNPALAQFALIFQHLQIYKIDPWIQRFCFLFSFFFFSFFIFYYEGKTPHKIDRSVKN